MFFGPCVVFCSCFFLESVQGMFVQRQECDIELNGRAPFFVGVPAASGEHSPTGPEKRTTAQATAPPAG